MCLHKRFILVQVIHILWNSVLNKDHYLYLYLIKLHTKNCIQNTESLTISVFTLKYNWLTNDGSLKLEHIH